MAEKEYIEREAAEELLSQPITMSMCLTREECLAKRSQRDIDVALLRSIPAADVRPVVRNEKKILDMTCGSRTMWFNKTHPAVVYCDKRREDFERQRCAQGDL